jgi:hypothetical protein
MYPTRPRHLLVALLQPLAHHLLLLLLAGRYQQQQQQQQPCTAAAAAAVQLVGTCAPLCHLCLGLIAGHHLPMSHPLATATAAAALGSPPLLLAAHPLLLLLLLVLLVVVEATAGIQLKSCVLCC